ncbi:hypothetical protein NE237_004192 [Protea cynaroides]|uniref:Uncharacterized protein n=1 Tax=Protea cynaroides TaxID=273540 RepID=A0A9Q0KI77_9MAGN|nr:hypothetical protein NE237_004192 [Protea cynaroides]
MHKRRKREGGKKSGQEKDAGRKRKRWKERKRRKGRKGVFGFESRRRAGSIHRKGRKSGEEEERKEDLKGLRFEDRMKGEGILPWDGGLPENGEKVKWKGFFFFFFKRIWFGFSYKGKRGNFVKGVFGEGLGVSGEGQL